MSEEALKGLIREYVTNHEAFLWGTTQFRGAVLTLDEHAQNAPAKPLPNRPHLRELANLWVGEQTLLIFKSRQMLVSWLMCSLILWDCGLKPGKRWLVCCKEFNAADTLLERIWFIYERLPPFLKVPAVRKQGFITFNHGSAKSVIQAAAQTSDAPRSQTFSGILIDEMEFTDNAAELHTASLPTIVGGGKFVGVSTPNGKGYMWQLATDEGRIKL